MVQSRRLATRADIANPTSREWFKFFSKIEKRDGHWIWPKGVGPRGNEYPEMTVGKFRLRVHRIAWLWWCGEIDEFMKIRSICGERLCVNPFHLMQAPTGFELWQMQGFCKNGHPLDLSRTKILAHNLVRCSDCANEAVEDFRWRKRQRGWIEAERLRHLRYADS